MKWKGGGENAQNKQPEQVGSKNKMSGASTAEQHLLTRILLNDQWANAGVLTGSSEEAVISKCCW